MKKGGFLMLVVASIVMTVATGCNGCNSQKNVPVQTKSDSRTGVMYIWIPPGTFQMGCSGKGCANAEKPAHSVSITKGFWLAQTPTTRHAFRLMYPTDDSQDAPEPDYPMQDVTWFEARNYCSAVGMRLPTEAEWEYAAQKQYQAPNQWEIYGLGFFWEWVADFYDASYYGQSPLQDPPGPSSNPEEYRVLRGGAGEGSADHVRKSMRRFSDATGMLAFDGFGEGVDPATTRLYDLPFRGHNNEPLLLGDRKLAYGFRCAGDSLL